MANSVSTLTGLTTPVTFLENTVNAAPQIIDADVTFTDPDNNFDGGTLTVAGLLAQDTVAIRNQGTGTGEIGVSGSNVSFGGILIGSFAGGAGSTLTVTFNAAATAAGIEALIENLTYANSSDAPAASRSLELKVTDAAGFAAIAPPLAEQTGAANPFDGVHVGAVSAPSFADLDGDGDLDALVGENDGILNYFENTGTATAPAFTEQTGAGNPFDGVDVGFTSEPSFADLDGDGDLDAVVGEFYGALRYFENTGSATAPVFTARTGAANPFNGVDVGVNSTPSFADLDGDGDLDAVVGENTGTLHYFENTGSAIAPAFTERTGAANPFDGVDVGQESAPSFADLDGDGDLDAIVGERFGALHYFENTGTAIAPAFIARTGPFNGVDVGSFCRPSFADLDGDGELDAVVGAYDGNLRYFRNTTPPAPDFAEQTGAANPLNTVDVGAFSAPSFADLDGDGDLDAVVGANDGNLNHFENTGSAIAPAFTARTGTANPFDGVDGGIDSAPSFADLDGDGDLDAVAGEFNGTLHYFENTGSATAPAFTARTGAANPFNDVDPGYLSAPSFADLDGDGDLDAVVGANDGTLRYFENTGSATAPTFTAGTGAANPFDGVDVGDLSAPSFADLDGDGDLDAIVGASNGTLHYFENTGTATAPTFTERTGAANPFNGVDVGNRSAPSFADLDGDGDLDAVIGEQDGNLNYFRNTGAGFTLVVDVTAQNDAAVLSADVRNLTETNTAAAISSSGTLTISDPDSAASFVAQAGTLGSYGTFAIASAGAWTYTASSAHNEFAAGTTYTDAFQVASSDGTLTSVTINILGTAAAANVAPTLAGLTTPVTFLENTVNAAPQIIDADVTFTDPDNNFDGGTLTVTGLLAQDTVAIRNQGTGAGEIGVSGSDVSFGGSVIGGFAGGAGSTFTVTFSAAATAAAIEALIENLTYANSSDTPTASRSLELKVTDAAGFAAIAPLAFAQQTGAANPFDGIDVGGFSTPSFADLDGDGDLDAVVGASDDTLRFYENTGSAIAPAFTQITGAANPLNGVDVGFRSTPSFADLDGDGDLDAVVGEDYGILPYFENTGSAIAPAFTARTGAANPFNGVGVGSYSTPSFADLDGDGDLDAVVGEFNGTLHYFANTGTASAPTFAEQTGAANPFNGVDVGTVSTPSFADLDGDRDLDAVVGAYDGTLHYFENTGTAVAPAFTVRTGAANPFDGIDVGGFSAPSFADVDGDGDLDAIVGERDGTLNYFRNTGSGFALVVDVTAQSEAATLSADVRNLTETNAAAAISSSGTLTISDADSPATFLAQAGTAGSYGTFAIDSAGAWTYTASSAHDAFVAGTTYTDTFPVASADGTPTSVTINILGSNDAAVLSADVRNLTETNAAADISSSGTLTISDVDGAASFVAQAGTAGSYGTFAITSAGAWTYTASSAHDAFAAGTAYTDIFPVASADGTPTSVTINILGTNDAVVLSADVRNLTETNAAADISASGTLTINDPDSAATFVAQAGTPGSYGTFVIDSAGAWTYTASSAHNEFAAGTTYIDIFPVASADGTPTTVTINILGTADAAVLSADVRNLTETNAAAAISSSGTLTISDADSATTFVAQAGALGSYGTFAIDGAGAWTYTASSAHNAFVAGTTYTDTFSVASADGTPTSVTINIAGSNDTPAANAQSLGTDKDTAVAVMLSGSDVDGDSLAFAVLSGPAHGTLSGSGANRTYKPDPGYVGSDSFSYVANDGTLDSAPASVSLNVHLNIAPVVTAFDQSAARGQVFNASDLFSATDGDGDTLLYFFYDNSADPASGHFTVNGVVQAANTTFAVNAAQLAQTTFTAGQLPDDLFVNAWDFSLYSGPQEFHINVPVNRAPTATAHDQSAARGQVFDASDLFSASDGDGDSLLYFFYDNSAAPTSGHFEVNGVVQAAGTTFAVSAAQLAQSTFTAGTSGSDDLFVNAWDGSAFSGPKEFHVNVVDNAPTVTAPNQTASSGQVLDASSLFTANDADGDTLLYFFYDNSAAPTSGHFEINGVTQTAGTTFAVSQAQLAQTTFVAGTTGDDLFVNAWDGHNYSGPKEFHIDIV